MSEERGRGRGGRADGRPRRGGAGGGPAKYPRGAAGRRSTDQGGGGASTRPLPPLGPIVGTITGLTDKHYGFVTAEEWGGHKQGTGPNAGKTPPRYFFHSKGLQQGLAFAELCLGDRVRGEAVLDQAPGGEVKGAMLVRVGKVEEAG